MNTMRIFRLFCILAVLQIGSGYAQSGWEWSNPIPPPLTYRSIKFIGNNTGYAVGDYGTIVKTNDAGQTWICQESCTSSQLNSVHFIDANTGFAVGNDGTIIKTVNGGNEWFPMESGITNHLKEITFVDPLTGLIACSAGKVLKTTDGGITWILINATTYNLSSIFFTGTSTGFITGSNGLIMKTSDGGNTWATMTSNTSSYIYDLVFINSVTGYAVNESGEVLKSTNGGLTWSVNYYTGSDSDAMRAVFFTDINTGFAVGGQSIILKTTNGGLSWSSATSAYYPIGRAVFFTSSSVGFIAGSGTNCISIAKTTDGGNTWPCNDPGSCLYDIYFANHNTGYACGMYGAILKTTDGGDSWDSIPSVTSYDLRAIYFLNPDTGYAAGGGWSNGRIILKTTNGGTTWVPIINSVTDGTIYSLCFLNSDTGFAAGYSGKIIKTTDGGLTWINIESGTSAILLSMSFPNTSIGYVSGSNGVILKTTDGGDSWSSQASNTSWALKSISFPSVLTGYAAGSNGYVLKTIDGGNTWYSLFSGITTGISKINFINNLIGYAFHDGGILKTTDGGASWTQLTNISGDGYNSGFFVDANIGFAVHCPGEIIKTETGGEYIQCSADTIIIESLFECSGNSECRLPFESKIFINGYCVRQNLPANDSIRIHIWFGDGCDTIVYKEMASCPTFFPECFRHSYRFPGIYSLMAIVTYPDNLSDTVIVSDHFVVADTCGDIYGQIYNDSTENCIPDTGETILSNIPVKLFHNDQFLAIKYSNEVGFYSFNVPAIADYTIKADTTHLNGFSVLCPENAIYDNVSVSSISNDFALHCYQGFDLNVFLSGTVFRPGELGYLHLNIKNHSCNPLSGYVVLQPDSFALFVGSYPMPEQVSNDSLIWQYGDLVNLQDISIPISFSISPDAWEVDELCFTIGLFPFSGDNDTLNNYQNYCFPVINSWDPNMKDVTPHGDISGDTTLTYTVHFQNTGNAEAYNIFILDTIDENLDMSSFELVASSHPVNVYILNEQQNTIIKFDFPGIMLPDSTSNPLGSMGYVAYRLRTKPDLPNLTVIDNTAYIYFDFNPAIVTNTIENQVLLTSLPEKESNPDIIIYPNPARGSITIETNDSRESSFDIINLFGQVVMKSSFEKKAVCDVSQLYSGVYFVRVNAESKSRVQKLIIEKDK